MKDINEYRSMLVLLGVIEKKYQGLIQRVEHEKKPSEKETYLVSLIQEIRDMHTKQKQLLDELAMPL